MLPTQISYKWIEYILSLSERSILLDLFTKDTLPVYIAVSGGPDSMCLAQLIFDIFFTNSLDMSRIVILYLDHRTGNMPELYSWFTTYFSWINMIGCSLLPGNGGTETNRRKMRKQFFENHLNRTGGVLCTGHTLTDRIETTLLNLERWCRLRWFLNMHLMSKHDTHTHLRPLLSLPKYLTQNYCDTHSIPYRIDPSNKQPALTRRNFLRSYFQTEYLPSSVVQQRQNIYSLGEQILSSFTPLFEPIIISTPHENIVWFKTQLPKNRQELSCLLSRQKLYNWVTQAFLDELFTFLTTATVGYRYVRGTWICLAKKQLYFFPATSKTPFWKVNSDDSLWSLLTNNSRLPQPGDRYHGKLFSKRLSKKWVPFFVRPFVNVIAEGKEIMYFEITKGL